MHRVRIALPPSLVFHIDNALEGKHFIQSDAIQSNWDARLRKAFDEAMKVGQNVTDCHNLILILICSGLAEKTYCDAFVDPRYSPLMLCDLPMQAAFEAGIAFKRDPALAHNLLFARLQHLLCWWLSERQEVCACLIFDTECFR
jgi:hypothetical protein